MGQEGHQIPLALLGLLGGALPGRQLDPDGVQVVLDGGELPGQHHRVVLLFHQAAGGRPDVLQPVGEPPQSQVKGDEHEYHDAHGEDLRLVVSDIDLIEVQGLLLGLAKEGLGGPQEEPGKGVLEHAVDDHLQQEDAHRSGDDGAQHHHQQHFQLQSGVFPLHAVSSFPWG